MSFTYKTFQLKTWTLSLPGEPKRANLPVWRTKVKEIDIVIGEGSTPQESLQDAINNVEKVIKALEEK